MIQQCNNILFLYIDADFGINLIEQQHFLNLRIYCENIGRETKCGSVILSCINLEIIHHAVHVNVL